jgi:hypothetical protein
MLAQRVGVGRPVLKVLDPGGMPARPVPLQRVEAARTADGWPGRDVIYRWGADLPPHGCGFCGRCVVARGADGVGLCMVYIPPHRLADAPCPAGLAPLAPAPG